MSGIDKHGDMHACSSQVCMADPSLRNASNRLPILKLPVLLMLATSVVPTLSTAESAPSEVELSTVQSPDDLHGSHQSGAHEPVDKEHAYQSSVLDGKRLFFAADERDNAVWLNKSDIADLSAVEGEAGNTAQPEAQRRLQGVKERAARAERISVAYDGRIVSNNNIRIIINGKPCSVIEKAELVLRLKHVPVLCQIATGRSYQLALHTDGLTLSVSWQGDFLGSLRPGESL